VDSSGGGGSTHPPAQESLATTYPNHVKLIGGGVPSGAVWWRLRWRKHLVSRLDPSFPLLLVDPSFQDVVQVAGADDLLRSGVEDGRVQDEWLSL
jgi:hypothetical protein